MKNEQITVRCTGLDGEGRGVFAAGGRNLSAPGLLPGETAIVELAPGRGSASVQVLRIGEKSKDRAVPECPYFDRCGGCHLQHLSAAAQAEFKQKSAEKLLGRYGAVKGILTMAEPYFYRNKAHAVLACDKKGRIISGIYEEHTHRVVPVEHCLIQDGRADDIIASVREIMRKQGIEPFDEDTGRGFLRHILIRTGHISGQVMVVLVASSRVFGGKNNFIGELLRRHPEITTIVMNVNGRKTSAVLGSEEKVLYGKGYIEDTLCGCVFRISPRSFYQINPVQTEVLYGRAIEMAKLSGDETVLDAYCGIGTISLIASPRVRSVIGVELNGDAVKDAVRNAERNRITNARFYKDDAGAFMSALAGRKQKIDAVFMDPPRSGSDERFLCALVSMGPAKVIYISCNPATQARDLEFLTRHGYAVREIQPVDMFPQTYHTETVCLLERG